MSLGLRRWLRRLLLGRPCRLCALPVPRGSWDDHMAWHAAVALAMGRPVRPDPRPARTALLPSRPVPGPRPTRPKYENGGPA